jgi:hypothetical protein
VELTADEHESQVWVQPRKACSQVDVHTLHPRVPLHSAVRRNPRASIRDTTHSWDRICNARCLTRLLCTLQHPDALMHYMGPYCRERHAGRAAEPYTCSQIVFPATLHPHPTFNLNSMEYISCCLGIPCRTWLSPGEQRRPSGQC